MPGDWKGRRQPFDTDKIPYASSKRFAEHLRDEKPWLLAPENQIVPLDGALSWDNEDEALNRRPNGDATCGACSGPIEWNCEPISSVHRIGEPNVPPCPKCGGAIEEGSLLYCPRCGASGFDLRLASQEVIVGVPPADPPKRTPVERTASGAIPLGKPGKSSKKSRRKAARPHAQP